MEDKYEVYGEQYRALRMFERIAKTLSEKLESCGDNGEIKRRITDAMDVNKSRTIDLLIIMGKDDGR